MRWPHVQYTIRALLVDVLLLCLCLAGLRFVGWQSARPGDIVINRLVLFGVFSLGLLLGRTCSREATARVGVALGTTFAVYLVISEVLALRDPGEVILKGPVALLIAIVVYGGGVGFLFVALHWVQNLGRPGMES